MKMSLNESTYGDLPSMFWDYIIYRTPITLQLHANYVPHPMHHIIPTLIASALNVSLHEEQINY